MKSLVTLLLIVRVFFVKDVMLSYVTADVRLCPRIFVTSMGNINAHATWAADAEFATSLAIPLIFALVMFAVLNVTCWATRPIIVIDRVREKKFLFGNRKTDCRSPGLPLWYDFQGGIHTRRFGLRNRKPRMLGTCPLQS